MTKKKSEESIGQKIRKRRLAMDLTQEALARKADIPYTTLVKIESDAVKNPSIDTVTKIVAGLGITLDELINS
ncbi:helix-turn-helix transcriptional regulator [Candidatus Uhrbacteria bacterium]|nr:helix-turn-helix transcriptional regulator [Candidatus Uhrbacteria bacterium]